MGRRRRVTRWGLAGLVAAGAVAWVTAAAPRAAGAPTSQVLVERVRTLGGPGAELAARQLAAAGREAVPVLSALASDPAVSHEGRAAAVRALGGIRDDTAVAALESALGDPFLQHSAAAALAEQGQAGFDVLIEALAGPRSVAGEAAFALGRLGDRRAVPALAKAYRQGVPNADEALAALGKEGVSALLEGMRATKGRFGAIYELRNARGQPGVEAMLIALLSSADPMEREAASKVLSWGATPAAIRALTKALRDPNPLVSGPAAEA